MFGHKYYLLMERGEKTLENYYNENRPVTNEVGFTILKQLSTILGELNKMKVLHRSIQPSNLVINENEENGIIIKLMNFECGKCLDNKQYSVDVFNDDNKYRAPELLIKSKHGHTAKVDVYSSGIRRKTQKSKQEIREAPVPEKKIENEM